jgi:hypothetical protein
VAEFIAVEDVPLAFKLLAEGRRVAPVEMRGYGFQAAVFGDGEERCQAMDSGLPCRCST